MKFIFPSYFPHAFRLCHCFSLSSWSLSWPFVIYLQDYPLWIIYILHSRTHLVHLLLIYIQSLPNDADISSAVTTKKLKNHIVAWTKFFKHTYLNIHLRCTPQILRDTNNLWMNNTVNILHVATFLNQCLHIAFIEI